MAGRKPGSRAKQYNEIQCKWSKDCEKCPLPDCKAPIKYVASINANQFISV